MAVSFSAGGAVVANTPSSPWTISSVTLGTGDIYFSLYNTGYAGDVADLTVSINGNSASLVTSTANNSVDLVSIWKAANTGATGNIVVTGSLGFGGGLNAANWFNVTGEGTPVITSTSASFTSTDPQGPITGTISTGGAGIACIFATIMGGSPLPTAWTGATRSAAMEAWSGTGNQMATAAASISTVGAASAAVSGTSGGAFSGTVVYMQLLAFPAAGGASPITNFRMLMGIGT